jgi:hypothetical protein
MHRLSKVLPALLLACSCPADSLSVGVLSFDVFIPASGTPGVNAFDIFNYTGPTYGPTLGAPYVSPPVTLGNLSLTVLFQGGASQTFTPANVAPGELLDSMGNPVIQFPSTTNFTSALLTATLSATNLQLSNGSTFNASSLLSVSLTPSSGMNLQAGTDLALINAQSAAAAGTPEPASLGLVLLSSILLFVYAHRRSRQVSHVGR